jgi:restriction endonuclease S subunit
VEEFIPTFREDNNILAELDSFEDNIKQLNILTKQYDELKKKIKEQMVEIGKNNKLEQVKWITPNNIQITCSIGKEAEREDVKEKTFNVELLKEKYPNIYEECCIDREYTKVIKAATSDRLVITLPKE